jgi:hypothetical protein
MRTTVKSMLGMIMISLALLGAPRDLTAQQQCWYPRQEEGRPCCSCFGPAIWGYWNCTPTCNGYCTVWGECSVSLRDVRISPDGSILANAINTAVRVGSGAASSRSVSEPTFLHVWEGKTARQLRNCRGFVVARIYSRDAAAEMRVRSNSISI